MLLYSIKCKFKVDYHHSQVLDTERTRNCEVCHKLYKAQEGGRKPNRKGKAKGGRPPKHSKIWTQTLIESLGKDKVLDTMPQISIQYFNKQNNPHIEFSIHTSAYRIRNSHAK